MILVQLLLTEECPAGQHSEDGIIPCFKCGLGEYQPEPGQKLCLQCPDDTTCLDFGSQSMDQCLGRYVVSLIDVSASPMPEVMYFLPL